MLVGKHHIFVCTQAKPPMVPSCGGFGGGAILESFRSEVFKAGLEKDIIVTGSGCVGTCSRGANVMVFPEGKWYTAVKEEDVTTIVQEHLIKGNLVEDRNDPDPETILSEVCSFQERIKLMMQEAGKL
ncbi:MAG: (2Fe-2S) ferredoxin domain-containing protein [Leptospirales bacterium]